MLVLRERGKLMPWFKVDDGFTSSPKVISIPRSIRLMAIGAWTSAGNYSAKNLTDGYVPNFYLDDIGAPQEIVEALVKSGLWDLAEDGIQFHDWCEYQPSGAAYREKQEAIKAKRSEAGTIGATKRWSKQDDSKPIANEWQTDSPEPEPESSITKVIDISSNAFDEEFNQFWAIYPRKENKQSARRAFKQALKAETLEAILAGALRYRDDPNRDPMFTKHAATWLNNQCWNDDPLPARNKANAKQAQQALAAEKFLASFNQPKELTTNPDWA